MKQIKLCNPINKDTIQRYALFVIGLFFSALGVAITKKGELGVSPISSAANVMSIRFPQLSLGYWLIINIVLFIILGAVWFGVRKKEHFRRWTEYLLLIPIAYGLGHLCVLGFQVVSYSEWRDFQLILAISSLLYCALLLALNIFYAWKALWVAQRREN